MRLSFTILVVVFVLLAGLIGLYRWDSSRNRGSSFGYYGEFNRVSSALVSIPGVTVTQAWYNADVSLEEFGFGITMTGLPVRLFFSETDSIRSMKHAAAVSALQRRIESELTASITNK